MLPPSVLSAFTCMGLDLSDTFFGNFLGPDLRFQYTSASIFTKIVQADFVKLKAAFIGNKLTSSAFVSLTKDQCTALYSSKLFQCEQILVASDPFEFMAKNPVPKTKNALSGDCSLVKAFADGTVFGSDSSESDFDEMAEQFAGITGNSTQALRHLRGR